MSEFHIEANLPLYECGGPQLQCVAVVCAV